MKIGIVPINVGMKDHERVAGLVKKAEEVGLESVWTFEHVIVPETYESRYPYDPRGKMAATPETSFIDPLIAIAFAAAHTSTIRFGTGVNILPQANPLFMAKQVASLDVVSGGRLMLGIGTGWLREEYQALGATFERRGARFDDYLTAMKKVWSGEVVEHKSDFIDWSGFKSHPTPLQKPHPPLIIGGSTPPALRRVVEHGDGWFAPSAGVDNLKPQLETLRKLAREAGRDPETIEISAMWPYGSEGVASISQYEDLGVSRLILHLRATGERNPIIGLDKLGEALTNR